LTVVKIAKTEIASDWSLLRAI